MKLLVVLAFSLFSSLFISTSTIYNLQTVVSSMEMEVNLERKKGVTKKKLPTLFEIDSDDGNTYNANIKTGYDVGDEVYHSDPTNGLVVIEGIVE